MTNEEIRLNHYCKQCRNYDKGCDWLCRRRICNEADAYEMALDEKDQQFKEYLTHLIPKYQGEVDCFKKDIMKYKHPIERVRMASEAQGKLNLINKIINELFGE